MKNIKNNSKNIVVETFIVFSLFFFYLFFGSLKTLSRIFSYGIFKKEILTRKSNLGFDLKIKMK